MDTVPFASLLVMWAYCTFIKYNKWASSILTALIVLMRFEGLLVIPFWILSHKDIKVFIYMALGVCLYYFMRYEYYGTILSNAYLAKQVIIYYQSNPMQMLMTWKTFAIVVPIFAIIGICIDKKLAWLGGYILIFSVACILGTRSDWVRYSVPIFTLMIICCAPIFRTDSIKIFLSVIFYVIIGYQGHNSIKWMEHNACNFSYTQQVREEAGKWLENNIDKSQCVISGDIGAIGYFAPSVRFIDTIGLTSKDVISAYKNGNNLDKIIDDKNPKYICDTFEIKNNALVYTHGNGKFVKNGKASNIPDSKIIFGKQTRQNIAIAIGGLQWHLKW
jgi:hypothetical protein